MHSVQFNKKIKITMKNRIKVGFIIMLLYTIACIIGVVKDNMYFLGIGWIVAFVIVGFCMALESETDWFDKTNFF